MTSSFGIKTMIEYFQNHPKEKIILSRFNENTKEDDWFIEEIH